MPREDCTLVTGKSIFTHTAYQRHFCVFGRRSHVLTLLPVGNDLGRRPGYGISRSLTTGAMVGLFVSVGFLLTYCNKLCSSLYGLLKCSRNSYRIIIQSSKGQSIKVLTDSD